MFYVTVVAYHQSLSSERQANIIFIIFIICAVRPRLASAVGVNDHGCRRARPPEGGRRCQAPGARLGQPPLRPCPVPRTVGRLSRGCRSVSSTPVGPQTSYSLGSQTARIRCSLVRLVK